MSIHNFANAIVTGSSGQGGGGVVEQSLKFNDDDLSFLTRVFATDGNRKTWTWSGWIKRANIGTAQRFWGTINGSSQEENIRFEANNTIRWYCHDAGGTAADNDLSTVAVFRDVTAWYHIQIVKDTTESTAANRNKLYVNGVLQSWAGTNYATLNYNGWINASGSDNYHRIGAHAYSNGSAAFDGYMAEVNFVDGQALDPTSFGQTVDGYWAKKDYEGSYGTNGFRLTFQDDVVSEGFNTVTYTGNGGTQSISGLGFQNDLLWIKSRSDGAGTHRLIDSVRGGSLALQSENTGAEIDNSAQVTSPRDADGFTVAGNTSAFNQSGDTYVAWAWDAGSGSAASNTDGSITSTVKANPSYGFSIGTFTKGSGTETFGHGLTSAPELLILKRRDSTGSWFSYSSVTGADKWIRLNGADAATTSSTFWNNTAPTSSVATISTAYNSGEQVVFYAFNSVAGYSSIGSYTGNGSASGPTVTTGFAPAWVMVKRSDGTGWWAITDNTRSAVNPRSNTLAANESYDEATLTSDLNIDFTSTGFQIKDTDAYYNASGGTYIYMAFKDTRQAAFWKDVSGQGNHWTPSGLDYRDSLTDSPANNFATLNPLAKGSGTITFSEGNLKSSTAVSLAVAEHGATFTIPKSGKWYWEAFYTGALTNGSQATLMGIMDTGTQTVGSSGNHLTTTTGDYVTYYSHNNAIYINNVLTNYTSEITTQTSAVVGFAVDMDNGHLWVHVNGTYINGTPDFSTGGNKVASPDTTKTFLPFFSANGGATFTWTTNFGQDSTFAGTTTAGGNTDANGIGTFKYAPPDNYLALCSQNLPTPTIVDGSENFVPYLYTADGTSPKSRTGLGFSADFLWFKDRTVSLSHALYDTIRGPNKGLQTNTTNPENSYNALNSFDADGFTTITDGVVGNLLNNSTDNYVTWAWKAGGTPTATNSAGAGAVPTSGSVLIDGVASTSALAGTIAANKITANTAAGFSIINYTGNGSSGQTVGHGLSSTPEFLIMKDKGTNANNNSWNLWHKYAGDGDDYGYFTTTAHVGSAQIIPNGTDTIELKANLTTTNQSGHSFIMYAFHSVDGYSKVGSFTGNSNVDGAFVYTGFRPSFVLFRSAATSANWYIIDNKRNPSNVVTKYLRPVITNTEGTLDFVDFLSNGFKLRSSSAEINGSNVIYLAIAETPFKYSNAR